MAETKTADRVALLKKLRADPGCGDSPVAADSVAGAWIAWKLSKNPAKLAAFRAAVDGELGGAPAKPAATPPADKKPAAGKKTSKKAKKARR